MIDPAWRARTSLVLGISAWIALGGMLGACSGSDSSIDPNSSSSSSTGGTSSGGVDSGASGDGATSPERCGHLTTPCAADEACEMASDCASGVCSAGRCQAPTPLDGVKNGDETGVDCGGTSGKKCPTGQGCKVDADCDQVKCDLTTNTCTTATASDGIQNGDETDVDCGGAAPKCATGKKCLVDGDCANQSCNAAAKTCDAPTATDTKKNGNESDVDCGSSGPGENTNAPRCDAGKTCAADNDCRSGGCNHKGVCAAARSCTMPNGGTTCGTGDALSPANQNEDCCASELVPTYNADGYNNTLPDFRLDKYQITAGRIRRFLTAVNGNVKGWVQANRANVLAPAQLPPAEDIYLPAGWTQADSNDNCYPEGTAPTDPVIKCNYGALNQVSGYRYNNQPGGDNGYGCYVSTGGYSTRTYRTTAAEDTAVGVGEETMLVPQTRTDQKSMTCSTYFILAAFCAWDGGRLETFDEYNAAYGGDATNGRVYPWQANVAAPDPTRPIGFADLFSTLVAPTSNYGYTPPADPNGQYSVYNASLTATQKTNLLLRIDRANLRWTYFNAQILDYRAPLQDRVEAPIAAENMIDVANDSSVAVAPPGRYPMGAGRYGHRDLLGNVMEISATGAGTATRKWTRNGSFETAHFNATTMVGNNYSPFNRLTKYGRAGGRCARPVSGYLPTPLP